MAKPYNLTIDEKKEILLMYLVKGMSLNSIAKVTGRNRASVTKVVNEDKHLFEDTEIEQRIRDHTLKAIEKHSVDVNETSGMIMKALQKEVSHIIQREHLTAADINMLLNINKQIQQYQSQAISNSEKINYNKKTLDLKERELESKVEDDTALLALMGEISSFGKKGDE